MAIWKDTTLDDFQKTAGFDVAAFLAEYVSFIETDEVNISDYYGGNTDAPNAESFSRLKTLLKNGRNARGLFQINRSSFNSMADWNLLETLEDVINSLETIDNASRYLRSSIFKNNFSPNPEIDVAFTAKEKTLEFLSRNKLNSINEQNDWIKVALRNVLEEEDYTPEGGLLLKATLLNGESFFINSVVDNIVGKRVYGIDILRKLTFDDDDLATLSFKDTIEQAVSILLGLRKNHNPEYPSDGIDTAIVAGTTLGSIAYPVIFRQLFETFSKDDTLKSFSVVDISQNSDSVAIEIRVETRLDELIDATLNI